VPAAAAAVGHWQLPLPLLLPALLLLPLLLGYSRLPWD
jgi:hypothetical protein